MIACDPAKLPHLFAALAQAQGEFPPIPKNRHVVIKPRDSAAYEFDFADLEGVLRAVRPALAGHGLAVVQPIMDDEVGKSWLVTALLHSEGGALVSRVPAPEPTADPKQYGGLLTYMRRYMLCALLCIAADHDLDEQGDGGSGQPAEAGAAPPRQEPPPARRSEPVKASAAADSGPPESISEGQLKNLLLKVNAIELDDDGVTAMLARLGVPAIDRGMSLADWKKVKAELDTRARAV